MQIIHSFVQKTIKKDVLDAPKALLTNRNGSYFLWEDAPTTRYSGFFWYDVAAKKMFKIIEQIKLKGSSNTTQIINNIHTIRKHSKEKGEAAFMPSGANALAYTLEKAGEIEIMLDMKESYDNREWGRHYNVWEEKKCIIVEFVKRTDHREDSSHDQEEYRLYLAIAGQDSFTKPMEWIRRDYSSDAERNSPPLTRYAVKACIAKGKSFIFSVSRSKDAAIKEALSMLKKKASLPKKEERALAALKRQKDVAQVLGSKQIDDATKDAFLCALTSLDKLIVHDKSSRSLFAGLPWFFQSWSRDSLISLKALEIVHPTLTKDILLRYLSEVKDDGRIPNVIGSSIGSADGVGWLIHRAKGKKLDEKIAKRSATKAAEGLMASHTQEGLEVNGSQETWMDSKWSDDARAGKRIEIQALRLALFGAAREITGNGKYALREKALKEKVRKTFWTGKVLLDGDNDPTIRPNLFIAAYIYPDLLSQKEWEICLENATLSLWLSWGGLATIDLKNPLFQKNHTGQSPQSYHRGDSWFWINNLAALVMYRTNKQKFKKVIEKIVAASTEEILWKGAIGHHAELSSASSLKSQGCLSQAWSSAMYVELVKEISS